MKTSFLTNFKYARASVHFLVALDHYANGAFMSVKIVALKVKLDFRVSPLASTSSLVCKKNNSAEIHCTN